VRREAVVLADEQHRKFLDDGEVEALVKDSLLHRSVAEEGHGDPLEAVELERQRRAHGHGHGLSQDGRGRDDAGRGIVEVHRPASPARAAGVLAVQLRYHAGEVASLGQVMRMAAMAAVDDIVPVGGGADPDRHRFLPDREMGRRPHLLLSVEIRQRLFRTPDSNHLSEQAKPEVSGMPHVSLNSASGRKS
jgi:hypothetical protein